MKRICYPALILLLTMLVTSCGYLQMNPPPDAEAENGQTEQSSWLTSAANMLAAAGYGRGRSPQEKAESIYQELIEHFGNYTTGWTDTALEWWLGSEYNNWNGNPYKVVTVYGLKSPRSPWKNPSGANFIAGQLRIGNKVAVSLSWPDLEEQYGSGGLVLNCWGDNLKENNLGSKIPQHLRVTDGFRKSTGVIQTYRYDKYSLPNPGGISVGQGWYLSYDENHPFIKNVIVLSPVNEKSDVRLALRTLLTFQVYNHDEENARGFHYELHTSLPLLGHTFSFDPAPNKEGFTQKKPTGIVDLSSTYAQTYFQRSGIVPGRPVMVESELITPEDSRIDILKLGFIYNDRQAFDKKISFRITSPGAESEPLVKDISGGYILGTYSAGYCDDTIDDERLCEVRFIQQYPYYANPERHTIEITCDSSVFLTNMKIGHSYGWIDADSLWKHENWMTFISDTLQPDGDTLRIDVDWHRLLPYPEGEDITDRLAEIQY